MTRSGFASRYRRCTAERSRRSYSLERGTVTLRHPRASSAATTRRPRNPEPPVTTTRAARKSMASKLRDGGEGPLPFEFEAESLFELRMLACKPRAFKAARPHPLACEQRRHGHFAEEDTQRDGRHRRERGPAEDADKRRRELRVRHGRWGHGVDGSSDRTGFARKPKNRYVIGKRDPSHPLPPAAQSSAETGPERRQQPCQRSARSAQHESRAPTHPAP